MKAVLLWLRQDLRLHDQPALLRAHAYAKEKNLPLIALYIWDKNFGAPWSPGSASRLYLYHALKKMENSLATLGITLSVRQGEAFFVFQQLLKELSIEAVFWNRLYDPFSIERDTRLKSFLKEEGIAVESFNSSLLIEPWKVLTKEKKPYQVFTPFWRACLKLNIIECPLPAPIGKTKTGQISSENLEALELLPNKEWSRKLASHFTAGEEAALQKIEHFLKEGAALYPERRDRPDLMGTSHFSPHLHFGEVSPRLLWQKFSGFEPFLRQLMWREFAHSLLFHFPDSHTKALRPQWDHFPWQKEEKSLSNWQLGKTGYPIVDAGMRELWETGWMHNRVRMIVGSFLVKDLRISWLSGAKWFWDTLIDADLANNSLGWQWIGGSGADAAPYFRIFNPTLQGEKFDPEGHYVKKWLPALKNLEPAFIHKPWTLSREDLLRRNIRLGKDYPFPIVDHKIAKEAAEAAYREFQLARCSII